MSVAAADPHHRPTHPNDGYLSEESEYTDDHDDVSSDKVLLVLVPVVVPMIAKMVGRYGMLCVPTNTRFCFPILPALNSLVELPFVYSHDKRYETLTEGSDFQQMGVKFLCVDVHCR